MKKLIFIFLISVSLINVSCEGYTEDLNKDPNNFNSAPAELIIGQAQLGWMQLATSNSARYAGIFMNHFTGEDRQYLTVNNYSTTAADYDDSWDDAYVRGIAQAKFTQQLANDAGNVKLAAIAKIAEAAIFGELAALFGDIPFTEAADPDNYPTPMYDGQAAVLAGVQNMLSDAIANLGNDPATLYSGNRMASSATWVEIAYSLKARYYLIAKDYGNALTNARLGIDSPAKSLVTLHTSSTRTENLYYQFTVDRRDGYLGATGSHLVNLLSGVTPRAIATPGDANRFANYFKVQAGGNVILNNDIGAKFGEVTSMNLISYEEVKLIEAEAANRTGDPGDVAAFNEVRAHLATTYGGSFPATASASGSAALLTEILEEKYMTLVGELQPFHDVRRTNNSLNIPPKIGSVIPQRFIYPQSEIDTNPNVPSPLPTLFDKTPIN